MHELRHIGEVHPIPAGQQCERQKNSGDDCQNPHGVILLQVHLRLIKFPDLQGVFPQDLGVVIKPVDPRLQP